MEIYNVKLESNEIVLADEEVVVHNTERSTRMLQCSSNGHHGKADAAVA